MAKLRFAAADVAVLVAHAKATPRGRLWKYP